MKNLVSIFILNLLSVSFAFAQDGGNAVQGQVTQNPQMQNPSLVGAMFQTLPLVIIIYFIFYFFVSRPQEQINKQKKAMIDSLKRGDEVVTSSGMYGRVVLITDDTVLLEVFQGAKIKFNKDALVKKL